MKINSLKQSKGFTLVEILIVVIIVGLLAGIAVSKLGDSKEKAVQSVKKSAAAELNKAIQVAYVKGQVLPATVVNGAESAVENLVTQLQAIDAGTGAGSGAPFTVSSAAELVKNIYNTTPNGGTLSLTGAAVATTTLRDIEVRYADGTYAP